MVFLAKVVQVEVASGTLAKSIGDERIIPLATYLNFTDFVFFIEKVFCEIFCTYSLAAVIITNCMNMV